MSIVSYLNHLLDDLVRTEDEGRAREQLLNLAALAK